MDLKVADWGVSCALQPCMLLSSPFLQELLFVFLVSRWGKGREERDENDDVEKRSERASEWEE
jgi:hypothetical protein